MSPPQETQEPDPPRIAPWWLLDYRKNWRTWTTEELRERLRTAKEVAEKLLKFVMDMEPYEIETEIDEISRILAERESARGKPP